MNQRNSHIDLSSSFKPKIRQWRVMFWLKSGKEELYSIYLTYFANDIKFG